VHGIYQFDEAVQAISALKSPLRKGFLPVSLVHARTKLVDVYDVRPVNAEEEGLPVGPYVYSSFPPLNEDQQRVAVVTSLSPSDVPDMSQLVTVDVEAISGSARRDSQDTSSVASADQGNQQPNEDLQHDEPISSNACKNSEDRSDHSDHEDLQQDDDHAEAAGTNFVSIETLASTLSDGIDSQQGEVVLDTDEDESPVDAAAAQDAHDSAKDSSADKLRFCMSRYMYIRAFRDTDIYTLICLLQIQNSICSSGWRFRMRALMFQRVIQMKIFLNQNKLCRPLSL